MMTSADTRWHWPVLNERGVIASIAAAAGIIYLLRSPWSAYDSLWAEDGGEFLQSAVDGAGWLQPYAGYLHFIPRVITAIVVNLPVAIWPIAVTVLSAFVAAGVTVAIFLATKRFGVSRRTRVLIALLTVLAPMLGYEVIGNTANLHSLLLWAAPWVFLAQPERWRAAVGWAGVVAIICLSETQAILFVPLLLLFWGERFRWPMRAAGLLAGAAQLIAFLATSREGGSGAVNAASAVAGYFLQVVLPAWIGSVRIASLLIANAGWWVALLALIPFIWATVVIWRGGASRWRWAVTGAWIASIALWLIGYSLNIRAEDAYSKLGLSALQSVDQLRYGVVPGMLLLAVMVLVTDQSISRVPTRKWPNRLVFSALAVAALIGLPLGQFSPHQQSHSWRADVAVAVEQCELDPTGDQIIAVAPDFMDWSITVPCAILERNSQ